MMGRCLGTLLICFQGWLMNHINLRRASSVFALFFVASQAFATQIIYGFDQALIFKTTKQGPFFVQAGVFRSADLANELKRKIATRTQYPVQLTTKDGFNTVRVGPLMSTNTVREVGATPVASHTRQPRTKPVGEASVSKKMPNVYSKSGDKSMPAALSNSAWFVNLDYGQVFPHLNETMTVHNGSDYPSPQNVDQFSTKKHNQTKLGFQIGRRWQRDQSQWLPAYTIGLKYQHLFRNDIRGSITQYSLPQFNNYSYRWATSANVLSLNSKVDVTKWGKVMPYINAGLGTSINHAASYRESAYAGVTPRISPDFRSRSKAKFYYGVGAGLDMIINPQVILSAGYDYQSFGAIVSGKGQTTWSEEKLSLGNFGNNTVLIGLTYILSERS